MARRALRRDTRCCLQKQTHKTQGSRSGFWLCPITLRTGFIGFTQNRPLDSSGPLVPRLRSGFGFTQNGLRSRRGLSSRDFLLGIVVTHKNQSPNPLQKQSIGFCNGCCRLFSGCCGLGRAFGPVNRAFGPVNWCAICSVITVGVLFADNPKFQRLKM